MTVKATRELLSRELLGDRIINPATRGIIIIIKNINIKKTHPYQIDSSVLFHFHLHQRHS